MAKSKSHQRARSQLNKCVQKLVKLLYKQRHPVETYMIAYQLTGSSVFVTNSLNLSRFVRVSNGLNQVFQDAAMLRADALELNFQSPTLV